MKTLKLTEKDFKDTDSYYKIYCGKTDVSNYDGHIEIEGDLGWVYFEGNLSATGHISSGAGTGIEAGKGIKAGEWIKAGLGIKAGLEIEAGCWVEAGEGIEAGTVIKAGYGIKADWGIEAGGGIEAGDGIEAGLEIKAGEGIKADLGIKAGLWITCKHALEFSNQLFAGICYWKNITNDEKTITCGKLIAKDGGTVEYGIVKEIGMPGEKKKLSGKEVEVEIDGVKYTAVIQ